CCIYFLFTPVSPPLLSTLFPYTTLFRSNFEYTVSNKIFECIHAGLPVILSPVKEHQYLNDKYNFGIVVDEVSPKSIAEAVRKLKSNPELYSELRKNAIEASKVLNWENESKKLVKLYMQ